MMGSDREGFVACLSLHSMSYIISISFLISWAAIVPMMEVQAHTMAIRPAVIVPFLSVQAAPSYAPLSPGPKSLTSDPRDTHAVLVQHRIEPHPGPPQSRRDF